MSLLKRMIFLTPLMGHLRHNLQAFWTSWQYVEGRFKKIQRPQNSPHCCLIKKASMQLLPIPYHSHPVANLSKCLDILWGKNYENQLISAFGHRVSSF